MSYKVHLHKSIHRRILAWNLPDPVLVDVLLRWEQELGRHPARQLVRAKQPFDGMNYAFSLVDPTNRLREYTFVFHVVYGSDEETLRVVNCSYEVFGL